MTDVICPFQLQIGNAHVVHFLYAQLNLYWILSFGASIGMFLAKFWYRTIKITFKCS